MPASAHPARVLPLLLAALPLAAQDGTDAPPQPPFEIELRDDLLYADRSRDLRRNRLDLYLPRGLETPPLVMFVHGGAWMAGNKEFHGFVGRELARRGLAAAVINYRLSPLVRHPAHVEDCAAAFAFLRDRADELGFDGKRMFLMGHSAGAHLVSLLALDPRWLAAAGVPMEAVGGVIAMSAPFDVRRDNSLFRGVFGRDAEVRSRASPLLHVSNDTGRAGAPPFLVIWAERELLYLADDNEHMVELMEETDLPHRALEVEGHGHISYLLRIGKDDDPVTAHVLAAIDTWTAGK